MIRLTKKDIKFLSELKISHTNPNNSYSCYAIKASFKERRYGAYVNNDEIRNYEFNINLDKSPTGNCQMFSYIYINKSALMLNNYYTFIENIKNLKKNIKKEKKETNIILYKNSIKQYEIHRDICRKKYFAILSCLDYYNKVICSKKLFFADVNTYNLKAVEVFLKYFTKKTPKVPFTNYTSTNGSSMNIGIFELDKDKLMNYNVEVCKAKITELNKSKIKE